MSENIKYRIREYCGEFSIQIYGHEEKGILWWKKKEYKWCNTNSWGGVWQSYPVCQPLSKTFKSLEKAQQQVIDWQSAPVYHVAYNEQIHYICLL